MAWTRPKYSRVKVDAAGAFLVSDEILVPVDDPFDVINNWRSSHSYPLHVIKMALLGRAKRVDSRALIAQRLKRLSSIALKLHRNPHMQLSQMQDIGGCRAVVQTAPMVRELVKMYHDSHAKNPHHGRPEFVKEYDYLSKPKGDGYRSFHFVYRYQTKSKVHRRSSGLRI